MDAEATLARIADRLDALESKLDRAAPWSTEPEAAAAVQRLSARLERLEALVDTFGTLAERVPLVGEAAAATAGWAWAQAEARGIDPLAAGLDVTDLGLELVRPETLALARRALQQRALAEAMLGALNGVDPSELHAVVKSAVALLKVPELRALVEAGSDPAAVSTASAATTALVAARNEAPEAPSLWGVLKRLGDSDVLRAVGFGLSLARRFGATLVQPRPAPTPTDG